MFRSRKSREPRSIDHGAVVAANTIGKALVPSSDTIGGQVVDKSKIPRYNSMSGRTYSLVNSPKSNSRRGSVRLSGENGDRSSRYGSLRSANGSGKVAQSDADKVFHEFGGSEAKYVPGPTGLVRVDSGNNQPKMVSKYVPGSNGLVRVEIPLEQFEAERKNSIRRSASLRGGMSVRNSLSNKRSNNSLRANSISNRTSSGTPLKKLSEVPAIEEKRDTARTSHSPSPVPKITKTVYTSTARKVSEPVKNFSPPSLNNHTKVSPHTPERAITRDLIDSATEDEVPKIHTDLKVTQEVVDKKIGSDSHEIVEKQDAILTEQKQANDSTKDTADVKEAFVKKEQVVVSTEYDSATDENAAFKDASAEGPVDADVNQKKNEAEEEEQEQKQETAVAAEAEKQEVEFKKPVVIEVQPESNKGTLAQYIRSANPELQRVSNEDTLSAPKIPLEKTPSPIKSAMKKTNHAGQKPQASGAYLSLTTKENTRLNAQLSHESLRDTVNKQQQQQQQQQQSQRQQSVLVQHQQPLAPKRSSQRPQSMMAQRVTGDRRSFIQSNPGIAGRHDNRPRSTLGRPSANAATMKNSGLYPKEPPQKRSSFEKQRPMSTNLGFKNLSLRGDPEAGEDYEQQQQVPFQPPQAQRQSRNTTPAKNGVAYNGVQYVSGTVPLSGVASNSTPSRARVPPSTQGFKSRFADSDSDGESVNLQFSNQASRSTKTSSVMEPAPPPPVPYNPHATLRPQNDVQIKANHVAAAPEKKKKNKFSSKLKKLFGSKKH
ncbi:unnamed protein product [Kluyveromyces dobzhanskii CBS 2104]|uniref:WGS project CCBQ000000000 data, contig 00010 n=1 Tax=Kluyveromyces dobzhanskii CBS 2104 TaxID=1427455 RepID=A0A0A8LAC5_9SACH|nr:unnamed protein product [Kluyveromyces dobzhanskii CBS 2104]